MTDSDLKFDGEERYSDQVYDGKPPPVWVALSRVMSDVQSISKTQRNTQQNYNFRGVDAVVNAVGPALRKHGVIVVPASVDYEVERYTTAKGSGMKGVTVKIKFRFYGPAGDFMDTVAVGEAADAGDKATSKAHSVAYRTLLLQALCIPTDEPDPDASSHERAGYKPQEHRVEGPTTSAPKSWAELELGFANLNVDDVWLKQAAEIVRSNKISGSFQRLQSAYVRLLDHEPWPGLDVLSPPRSVLQKVFASVLDGAVLEGPEWRIGHDETAESCPERPAAPGVDVEALAEETIVGPPS